MKYEIIGASIYDMPYEEDDFLRNASEEARADVQLIALEEAMGNGDAVIRLTYWGGDHADTIVSGDRWPALEREIEGLAIKDGVDLVRFENGNLGLVAYYNRHKSYLEIIVDTDEVERIKDALREAGEYDD